METNMNPYLENDHVLDLVVETFGELAEADNQAFLIFARKIQDAVHETGRNEASMYAAQANASRAKAHRAQKDAVLATALAMERLLNQIASPREVSTHGVVYKGWEVVHAEYDITGIVRRRDGGFIVHCQEDNLDTSNDVSALFTEEGSVFFKGVGTGAWYPVLSTADELPSEVTAEAEQVSEEEHDEGPNPDENTSPE